MEKIAKLYHQYREGIDYLFWGVMTTIVNFVVYFSLTKILHIYYLVSNIIAWAVAVAFAYIVNKLFVFQSYDWHRDVVTAEVIKFTSARIFSGLLETGMLLVFVDFLKFPDDFVKIVASIVVVILNYVFSKWFIFNKK